MKTIKQFLGLLWITIMFLITLFLFGCSASLTTYQPSQTLTVKWCDNKYIYCEDYLGNEKIIRNKNNWMCSVGDKLTLK